MRPALVLALVLVSGCAHDATRTSDVFNRTMPNPEGCFLQVWDGSQYGGVSDFINGPREYPNLREMPNNRTWRNRIASLRVGPQANATAFTDENFQGTRMTFEADTNHALLPENVSAQIESLRIAGTPRS